MKYFTKDFPVEGEIKVGDLYFHKDSGNFLHRLTDIPWEGNRKQESKRVKLFLCSRDIQVGDKYIIAKTGEEVVWSIQDNSELDISTMKTLAINKLVFKVIGEISPEATWVKEGDEFNEKDIKLECWVLRGEWCYMSSLKEWPDTISCSVEETMKIVVQIKGPCGHFH